MNLEYFDVNCVVGKVVRPTPTTVWSPDEIVDELRRHRIAEAAVAHAHAIERSMEDGNQKTLEVTARHASLRPVWVIPQHSALDVPNPDAYVADMLGQGVRMVRVHPAAYHGHLVEDWALGPLWRALEAHRVPVLLADSDLARYPDGRSLGFSASNVHQICWTYPRLPVVLLRLNFSAFRVIIPLLQACPNLYVENSFFTVHNGLDLLVEQVGAERVLYGSGLPWGPPGPGIVAVSYARMGVADRALVAGGNARRLLAEVET